jgi:transposase
MAYIFLEGGHMNSASISKINPNCAGIDIGSEYIFIGIENKKVVSFPTFTNSYIKAIEYLKENKITSVAMEATGVYWFALYDLIEQTGIEVCLVNGREVKNVPGRKSDVEDCQWIQQLHSFGLFRPCFIPDDITRQLRTYSRLRQDHLYLSTQHIQHMQKAFDLMNIKLHNVISQVTGVSGMRIIKEIISGNHNPEKLASLCEDSILKKKKDLVISSLYGNFREDYIFLLSQAVDAYEFYQQKMFECDKKIQELLELITINTPTPPEIKPPKHIRHNAPQVDNLHEMLMKLTGGNDPSRITGLTDKTLLELLAETGTDLSKWKTEKHFTSWLCLAPGKHQSGKRNKKKNKRGHTKAGQIFRNATFSLARSKYSAISAFYHRIKSKKGAMVAIKATARKIAILYYNVMTKGIEFVEKGILAYQQKVKEQQLKRLHQQAKQLGLKLLPMNN